MWGEIDPKDKAQFEEQAAKAKAKWEKEKVGFVVHLMYLLYFRPCTTRTEVGRKTRSEL